MIEVNLIPDVKRELLRAQLQRNFVTSIAIIIAIAAGGLTTLMGSYVWVFQGARTMQANNQITSEFAKLESVEDLDKMLTIQKQLGVVSSLNDEKFMTSRIYDMLNVVVPEESGVLISEMSVDPSGAEGSGALITIEGQTVIGFSGLEVFEKTVASTVIEYNDENSSSGGDFKCSDDEGMSCKYLAHGDGDRSAAIEIRELNFGEDHSGARTLYFELRFEIVPELLSNTVSDVRLKVGKDGVVTDSSLGVPRSMFADRPVELFNEGDALTEDEFDGR